MLSTVKSCSGIPLSVLKEAVFPEHCREDDEVMMIQAFAKACLALA